MKFRGLGIALLLILMVQTGVFGQATTTRGSGGSITTKLGYGIALNEESTLQREWITVHDPSMLADIEGTSGVNCIYKSGDSYSSGGYSYEIMYSLKALANIVAFEIRILTFDVWGNHVRNLTSTEIVDLKTGVRKPFKGKWNIYSENEVAEHYASIVYVAQVRTSNGRVLKPNPKIILEEAQKFSNKFAESDLESTKIEEKLRLH